MKLQTPYSSEISGANDFPIPRRSTTNHADPSDGRPRGTLTDRETRAVTVFWAYFRYAGWQLLSKVGLGIVYLAIVSEGARRLVPSLGQKLYKLVPLLDRLDHRVDLAHCFALFILVGCWSCWSWVLEFWLGIKPYGRESTIVLPLAFVFIVVDAVLFYMSTATFRWGGAVLGFFPMLATAAYIAILIFVTFTGINLKQEIRKVQS